jgi:hypothetical protein
MYSDSNALINNKDVEISCYGNVNCSFSSSFEGENSNFVEINGGILKLHNVALVHSYNIKSAFIYVGMSGRVHLLNCVVKSDDVDFINNYSFISMNGGILLLESILITNISFFNTSFISCSSFVFINATNVIVTSLYSTRGNSIFFYNNYRFSTSSFFLLHNCTFSSLSESGVILINRSELAEIIIDLVKFINISVDETVKGGGLYIGNGILLTINLCLFENVSTAKVGGALNLVNIAIVKLNSTNFCDCVAVDCGGALFIENSLGDSRTKRSFFNCSFSNNNLISSDFGVDICDGSMDVAKYYDVSNVRLCSSTSEGICFYLSSDGYILDCLLKNTCSNMYIYISKENGIDYPFCGNKERPCLTMVYLFILVIFCIVLLGLCF